MQQNTTTFKDLQITYGQLLLDTETPISLYERIRRETPFSFLLESVESGNNVGRFSLVGWGARRQFVGNSSEPAVIARLEEMIQSYQGLNILPFNGFFGYLAYETVHEMEPSVPAELASLDVPLALFWLPEVLVVFDKLAHEVTWIINGELDTTPPDLESHVREVLSRPLQTVPYLSAGADQKTITPQSNCTQSQFESMVNKAKDYIVAGDIFQVVLSQRFSADYTGDPFTIYRHLCSLNPSPYMFYMNMGEHGVLLGTSPEIMLRKEGETLTIRPIAGTRKRGATPIEDAAIEKELLADEKENAEHVMLVDLARNDLNRVAEPETVKLESYQTIEKYSHVMHIVSSVTGTMRADQTVVGAVKATFPAGTLSGAPKVRAMQIIHELETSPRGTYGGLVGYFGLNGQFDSCITIRSVRVKDGRAYVQAGAGIVADSDPAKEYEETVNKAKAMFRAIERATI